jgi:hypothetical protein
MAGALMAALSAAKFEICVAASQRSRDMHYAQDMMRGLGLELTPLRKLFSAVSPRKAVACYQKMRDANPQTFSSRHAWPKLVRA